MSTATVQLCDLCGKPDATPWKINNRTADLCPDHASPIQAAYQAGRTTRANPRSKAPKGIVLREPYPDPPQRRGGLKVEPPQADPPAKR